MPYSKFSESLYKEAKTWAGRWTKLAKGMATSTPTVPGHVPVPLNHLRISTHVDRKSAQRFSLILTSKGAGARAYEYGSGIHAKRGKKQKYLIAPKSGRGLLVFYWERVGMTVGLPYVHHPGVIAANFGQGYIRPSAKELVKIGKKELKPIARKAILEDLQMAFKEGRKK